MPPYSLILCSLVTVLATFASQNGAPVDQRCAAAAGVLGIVVYVSCSARESEQLRALVVLALAAATLNGLIRGTEPWDGTPARTARYVGTALESTAEGTSIALDRGITVLASLRGEPPAIGDRVIVRGRLEPFDEARNPGEASERAIQRERGIGARIDGAQILARTPFDANAQSLDVDARVVLARAHAWARERLRDRLGEPEASVVSGELWGERAALPPDLRAEFQETGTVHVLVTAGLHLGVVAAIVLAVVSRLSLPRALACAVATAAIWTYVGWSGAQLPAVRAATMATAALAARACGRASFSWNALALGAIGVACLRPESVASASFALSFSCVGAIFALARPLERLLERCAALPDRMREALVLSLATQIGTWPVGAAIFLQFAPYALPANVAVVPCVAMTMLLGAAQLALEWIAPLAQAIANVNSWLLAWTLGVVRTLSSLPNAAIPMTPSPWWCVVWYDVALVAAPWLWQRGARTLAVLAVLLGAGWILWPPRAIDTALVITVLDVGQADAIVVRTPGGHTLLVDAGGRLERGAQGDDSVAERVGERVVAPFLLRSGIHALDALILSHPHGDHAGGIAPVLRKIRVAEFADSGQRYGGHAYQDALATASAQHVPIVYPHAGNEWRTDDGVTLHFIGPSLPFIANSRNDINENSIAFILRYKQFCMLFTGDAGAAAEERFLSEDVDLRCAILKVGHHGSAYSSTPAFIEAVHPRYAIISVGRHNLFGHPAPTTIGTLRTFGATVYRTDENAATTVTTDGATIRITPLGS